MKRAKKAREIDSPFEDVVQRLFTEWRLEEKRAWLVKLSKSEELVTGLKANLGEEKAAEIITSLMDRIDELSQEVQRANLAQMEAQAREAKEAKQETGGQ